MARTKTKPRTGIVPGKYLDLIHQFPLRPIRSEKELDRAIAVIDSLLVRDRLTLVELDYLDVLGDLVEHYENKYHAIPDVSESEMLEHFVDAKGVTQVAVARATGISESRISEVLAGKRHLTRAQITKLADYFHVSPAVFLPKPVNEKNDSG